MALNRLMHPRNVYKNKKPDFKALALKYEEFRKVATTDLQGKVHINFKKTECLKALSWALLKEDFNLDVDIPLDRLIPTIPLRLNYILWLEDILAETPSVSTCKQVTGIDIGCGASCIYPLLGTRKNGWRFVATESDEYSYNIAKKNVEKNDLQELVSVMKVEPSQMLKPFARPSSTTQQKSSNDASKGSISASVPQQIGSNHSEKSAKMNTSNNASSSIEFPQPNSIKVEPSSVDAQSSDFPVSILGPGLPFGDMTEISYDFCMCNPPFFTSVTESWSENTRNKDRRMEPWSVNTASQAEMAVSGGEVEFVRSMIADSLDLKNKIRVYSSMLGKKSSVNILKTDLRKVGISNIGTTEFCQGRTMRWGIAWSFDPHVSFPKPPSKAMSEKKLKPLQYTVTRDQCCHGDYSIKSVAKQLEDMFKTLEVSVQMDEWSDSRIAWIITAEHNTWSNQRRKRREKAKSGSVDAPSSTPSIDIREITQEILVENVASQDSCDITAEGPSETSDNMADVTCERTVKDEAMNNMPNLQNVSKRQHDDESDEETDDHPTKKQKTDLDNSDGSFVDTSLEDSTLSKSANDSEESEVKCAEVGQMENGCITDGETGSDVRGKRRLNDSLSDEDENEGMPTVKKPRISDSGETLSSMLDSVQIGSQKSANSTKGNTESSEQSKSFLVQSKVSVSMQSSLVTLEMSWMNGRKKDAMHQILQFCINQFKLVSQSNVQST